MDILIFSKNEEVVKALQSKGSCTVVQSSDEWKEKAGKQSFSLLITDFFGTVDEIISFSKEKKLGILATPSEVLQSNPEDNYPTIFWLVPSLSEKEIDLLLSLLESKKESFSEEEALLLDYQNSIFYKLSKIKALFHLYQEKKEIQLLENLTKAVHKLAGSSGTYGFTKVSDLSKKMESKLKEEKKLDEGDFKSYYEELTKAFLEPSLLSSGNKKKV